MPFGIGLPGWIKAISTPSRLAHLLRVALMSSGPYVIKPQALRCATDLYELIQGSHGARSRQVDIDVDAQSFAFGSRRFVLRCEMLMTRWF